MKKIILLAAALFMALPLSFGQIKVNKDSFLKKIEKSDADIANPKKASNPNTWIARGQLFYEAETAVSGSLLDMPVAAMQMTLGAPTRQEQVVVNNMPFAKYTFEPYMIGYADETGVVRAWEVIYVIDGSAAQKSIEAYNKAYELGGEKSAVAEKVAAGLKNNYDVLYKNGSFRFRLGYYEEAADLFARAYEVSQLPGFNYPSVTGEDIAALLYDSGMAYWYGGQYEKSIEYLTKAQQAGYESDGDVYYLLYYAYKSMAPNGDRDILEKAKEVVEFGMSKYPDNAGILDAVTDAYLALDEDPKGLVPIVERAIEDDPGNPSLWNGLGRLYDSLGELVKSAEAFIHVSELIPDNASAYYSVGLQYFKEADAIAKRVNADDSIATQAEYDAAMEEAYALYRKGIPYLEKAHELDPAEISTVELLKSATFLLRDEPGMGEKNRKYQALFNEMRGR